MVSSSVSPQLAVSSRTSTAEDENAVIAMWLHGRPTPTQRAYRSDIAGLRAKINKTIRACTLSDLQNYADSLADLAPSTRARRLAGIKSLFAFAHGIGYLPFDVARPLRLPAVANRVAERILSEREIWALLQSEPDARNRCLLEFLYCTGARVSEAASLLWRDLQPSRDAGQATFFGKGGKTRAVLLPKALWDEITAWRREQGGANLVGVNLVGDDPVFRSRKGGALGPEAIFRIVRAAAQRAGITERVSPHWLRHAHASHALDRGAPIHLVQTTLGHSSLATTGRYLHARPTDSSSLYLAVKGDPTK
jgi:integrase/recombinase XerD